MSNSRTTWAYQSDQLPGPGGVGSFTITNYRNGHCRPRSHENGPLTGGHRGL